MDSGIGTTYWSTDIHVWQGVTCMKKRRSMLCKLSKNPIQSEQLHHISQDGRVTMQFVGKAAGTEVDCLYDSGASTNYVSSAFAKLHGITVKPSDANVRLGTGAIATVKDKCSVHIKLSDYQDKVECDVLDMVTDFQVILGDMWLNMVKATFNYASKKCVIQKNNKRFTLSSSTQPMLHHNLSSRSKKEPPMLPANAGETSASTRRSGFDGSTL
jgi:hypothetical protein